MQNRIVYIDALRGFAILLVIVGHLIQFNYSSGIENPIFNIIYSFHMPLFFFISGCSRSISESVKGANKTIKQLIQFYWKSFISMIVPALSWTYIVPLFFTNKVEFPEFKFWFLEVLFVIMIIWGGYSLLYNKLGRRMWVMCLFMVAIATAFIVGIKRIPIMYLAMFVFGYYFQSNNWLCKIHHHIYSILCVIFCLSVGYFKYSFNGIESVQRVWLEFPLSIIAAMCLARLLYSIELLPKFNYLKVLAYIGNKTIGIYLCHFFFLNISVLSVSVEPINSSIIQFLLLLIIALGISWICIIIENITKRFELLYGILYGKRVVRK